MRSAAHAEHSAHWSSDRAQRSSESELARRASSLLCLCWSVGRFSAHHRNVPGVGNQWQVRERTARVESRWAGLGWPGARSALRCHCGLIGSSVLALCSVPLCPVQVLPPGSHSFSSPFMRSTAVIPTSIQVRQATHGHRFDSECVHSAPSVRVAGGCCRRVALPPPLTHIISSHPISPLCVLRSGRDHRGGSRFDAGRHQSVQLQGRAQLPDQTRKCA